MRRFCGLLRILFPVVILSPHTGLGQREEFTAPGENLGVWRLTFDPTTRDWANYHNTRCFSPDGRYVCFTRWHGAGNKTDARIHVFDLQENRDREIGPGVFPRWARHHNWLIYARYNRARSKSTLDSVETVLLDLDSGGETILADNPGAEDIGETTFDDRWLIAASRHRGEDPEFRNMRISLPGGKRIEPLPDVFGSQRMTNPRHPLFFTRSDHRGDPFQGTRFWFDLEGRLLGIGAPTLQQCHMSWSGDGEYMLMGNGLIRGRRWNQPFPSNVEILAGVGVGDISPCGDSGRWVCGDSRVADLRSGDGWSTVEPLSMIAFPAAIGDNSDIYDADAKGSPDGTKICFVTNYPIHGGPVAQITGATMDSIEVESTAGFPEKGRLLVQREVIGYERKTDTAFEGLTRKQHDTAGCNPAPGRPVTSFEARCLSEAEFAGLEAINTGLRISLPADAGRASPLARQRMTDVYVVVVRKPDRPHLRLAGGRVELIPGENHREIRGYQIIKNGQPVPGDRPPESLVPGEYRAVAIERSGLKSEPSLPLRLGAETPLVPMETPPQDFSWTGVREGNGIRETVHLHDGVIRREWLDAKGAPVRHHDFNKDGKATRRVEYDSGRMVKREYFQPGGQLVSRELFDGEGFITEQITYVSGSDDQPMEKSHWVFDRGMPVRHTRGGDGPVYEKRGDRWGSVSPRGKFIDLPRGENSK